MPTRHWSLDSGRNLLPTVWQPGSRASTVLFGMLADPRTSSPTTDTTDRLAAWWLTLIPEIERGKLVCGTYKQLIVVPDGLLSLLPFEALVVEQSDAPKFLLDAGPSVEYGPSATLVRNLAETACWSEFELKRANRRQPRLWPGRQNLATTGQAINANGPASARQRSRRQVSTAAVYG